MAKSHTLTLVKKDGQVSFSKEPAALFDTLMNGRYTVTITRERTPRSIDQNSLMWMWFTCISRETGTPVNDVHDYYCSKFLRKQIVWSDTQRTVVEGTSKLSKERMTDFLNNVQADAETEFGIRLPLPEDKYYEEFSQTYRQ